MTPMKGRTLIVFFSRRGNNYVDGRIVNLEVGNTEVAAGMVEKLTGGELYQIIPVRTYSDDYTACTKEVKEELRVHARPELRSLPDSIEAYDHIILCYPNWWGTMPMPVWTFLEKFSFSGKAIYPLCTHEGSGLGHSVSDIKKACHDAIVKEGLAIVGGSVKSAENDIAYWLDV